MQVPSSGPKRQSRPKVDPTYLAMAAAMMRQEAQAQAPQEALKAQLNPTAGESET